MIRKLLLPGLQLVPRKTDPPFLQTPLPYSMKKLILLLFVALTFGSAQAQSGSPVQDIFYGTRAVNLMTSTQVGKKVLAYRISHRFGPFNSGFYNLFGLDGPANISLAFDYGINDDLMIGIARDGFNKNFNGFVKYNALTQNTEDGSPVTLSIYSRANIIALRDEVAPDQFDPFGNRMSYITQLLVSRKFSERLSVQIAPTFVHHNLVNRTTDANSIVAVSGIAQYKFTKRLGLSAEYTYVITGDVVTGPAGAPAPQTYNSASLGLDIVTGGHVFQVCITNSNPINETFAIPYTFSNWLDGDIRLGFNISRKFWL